jgi:CO dehydrogenase maturation factor
VLFTTLLLCKKVKRNIFAFIPLYAILYLIATKLHLLQITIYELITMRIAFVGKGGSGKTTMSALFSLFIKEKNIPLLVIDADINMHLPELLGIHEVFPKEMHVSHPNAIREIKMHLKGNNARIKELSHFRKTTPPTKESNLICISDKDDMIIKSFSKRNGDLPLMIVGTYDTDDIGASCYHNNLSIFENILSHIVDKNEVVVTDMVAGVDAFANTLHTQFDLLVLVVEPTKRGLEVFEQYKELGINAGIYEHLFVVGNKVRNENDREFIENHIPKDKLLGFLDESEYLRTKDQEGGQLDIAKLEPENLDLLETVFNKLQNSSSNNQERLQKLWDLHRKYVAQDFIKDRFGDLTDQIDESFNFNDYIKE